MLTKLPETPDKGESHDFENAEEISSVIDSYSSQLWDINQKVSTLRVKAECLRSDASVRTL
jgi:hypothetical protein